MATWRVDIHDLNSGSAMVTGLPVKGWMFNYVLNSPGAFEADLNLVDDDVTEAILKPVAREIRVMRDAALVWGGYLWNCAVDLRQKSVRLQGEGYFSKLRRRVVTTELIYDDVNVQQIMWNLINHVQGKTNGDLGLTQGAHTGANRTADAEYCAGEFPSVAESIDALTQMDDGCDWIITPTIGIGTNKVFRTYQPRKGTDLTGSVTLDQDNLFNLTYEIDGSDLSNWVTYIGPGDCNPPDTLVQNGPSQSTYGLMEGIVETDDFDGLKDLNSIAREYLRNYKDPRDLAHAVYSENNGPAWGDFTLGDIIMLESNQGFATFSKEMRVLGVQCEMNVDAINFFDVTLDSVVD